MIPLVLPWRGIDAIVDDVRRHGGRGVESGMFVLAAGAVGGAVDTVALLGERGITRHPDQLIISGRTLARLFEWADGEGRVVLGQLHSHRQRAFMSETDRRFTLTARGFTSVVIPFAATASPEPRRWGWWCFDGSQWRVTSPASVAVAPVRIVVLDEEGVHG